MDTLQKKSNYSKLRVAFNNIYRSILKLPSRRSGSTMYNVNNIDSLEAIVRKRIFGFYGTIEIRVTTRK